MPDEPLSPDEIYEELLAAIREASPDLAAEIGAAIDLGIETEKPTRTLRPLTTEESIAKTIAILRAHFVEEPMFTLALGQNLELATVEVALSVRQGAPLRVARPHAKPDGLVVLEVVPKTAREQDRSPTAEFAFPSPFEIETEKKNLSDLQELLKRREA